MENQKSRIQEIISQGENSRVEFKSGSVRADSLAIEMSAFANTAGGIILVGVEDNCDITVNTEYGSAQQTALPQKRN